MRRWMAVIALASFAGCGDTGTRAQSTTQTGVKQLELDDVNVAPQGTSLVVLDGRADVVAFGDALKKMQGVLLHAEGTRLAIAKLPANADAVLRDLGVVAHYEAAIDPSAIGATAIDEQRFVRVFDNRYYPAQTSKALALAPTRVARAAGDGLDERAPRVAPASLLAADQGPDRQTTPFASGTIVVSILLPESNGVAEPSTEDWTEDAIVETYAKVQAACEAIARTEPNADLRFVLHYESSPDHGGLPGTIDSDYEFGKHANFDDGAGEAMATAPLLARLLGHAVTPDQVWDASFEYLNALRDRYRADGAFYVKVANDRNFTAGLRAHAFLNGPSTTLSTDYGFETFMHELGHVFGAYDEYCPDACNPPTGLAGYLGMINANAAYPPGGPGINGGEGEDVSSLMQFNVAMAVNGYTRGAWGWLDTDGDGLIEVRDTKPSSALAADARSGSVHLAGTITDVGATRLWGDARSFNRIVAVDVRPAGRAGAPWVRVPVTAPTVRGVATVDLDVGRFPAGDTALDVRAVSSVGNVEIAPRRIVVTSANRRNTEPRVSLAASPDVGSTRSAFTLDASAFDLDGDRLAFRFDTDGDGRFDTPLTTSPRITARFLTPGVHTAIVEARDAHGATARAPVTVLVTDGNALPAVKLAPIPSMAYGAPALEGDYAVASAIDPDGDAIDLAWTAELATNDVTWSVATGFSPLNTTFPVAMRMPLTLRSSQVDLAGGEKVQKGMLAGVVALSPTLLAAAAGRAGLLFTDVTNPDKPRLVAHLDLETEADRMIFDGARLYVTSPSLLSVVDVSTPTQPIEVKQRAAFEATRVASEATPTPIDDGTSEPRSGTQYLWESFGERIAAVSVAIDVDHPSPSDLRMSLVAPEGDELVLRDHAPGPGGAQTYTFDATNAPDLARLAGRLASGGWEVRVVDDVAGNAGTLLASTITFDTASLATPIAIDGRLLGVVSGRYPVIAGATFDVLDAIDPANVRRAATLPATGCYAGGMYGTTAIAIGPLAPKPPKLAGDAPAPSETARGLYAVDLRNPRRPVLARVDTSYPGGGLFVVGSRFYLTTYDGGRGGGPDVPVTSIGSIARFAAGSSYVLGALPLPIDSAYGDDRALVAVSTHASVVRLDVSDPARARVTASFFRPSASAVAPIDRDHVAIYEPGGAPLARLADLRVADAITSRVVRVTVQARDARGGVATASRAVHAIPYDHAPTIDAVSVKASSDDPDVAVAITASDPDRASWDPTLLARVDLDGDGIYDGDWMTITAGQPTSFLVPRATARTLRFQVRDGFFASDETAIDLASW